MNTYAENILLFFLKFERKVSANKSSIKVGFLLRLGIVFKGLNLRNKCLKFIEKELFWDYFVFYFQFCLKS